MPESMPAGVQGAAPLSAAPADRGQGHGGGREAWRVMIMEPGKEAVMFERAKRGERFVKAGVYGVSGSGKTWSALSLALGLAGKGRVALVDTEGGRSALLAEVFEFDMVALSPPFCPSGLVQALEEAQRQGYAAVVLDGLSQAWSGPGGVLEQVDEAKARGSRVAWQGPGQAHEGLLAAIAEAQCHVLATMRARPLWEMVERRLHNGATVRRRIQSGMRPEQRGDIEYLFDVFWQLQRKGHEATAVKDMSGLFGEPRQLTQDAGRRLLLWAGGERGRFSGLERALQAIRSCSSVAELAALWGNGAGGEDDKAGGSAWRGQPWQEVCSRAVAQRLRELQLG